MCGIACQTDDPSRSICSPMVSPGGRSQGKREAVTRRDKDVLEITERTHIRGKSPLKKEKYGS